MNLHTFFKCSSILYFAVKSFKFCYSFCVFYYVLFKECPLFIMIFYLLWQNCLQPISYVVKMFAMKMLMLKLFRTSLVVLPEHGQRKSQALEVVALTNEAPQISSPREGPD